MSRKTEIENPCMRRRILIVSRCSAVSAEHGLFPAPLDGGGDMHGFTILGDGPSGDIKATIAKDSDYFIVGQDILQRFCVDQRFDAVADGLCRRGIGAVKRCAHCKGEKYLSSYMPRGVVTYLLVVTRLTVLS